MHVESSDISYSLHGIYIIDIIIYNINHIHININIYIYIYVYIYMYNIYIYMYFLLSFPTESLYRAVLETSMIFLWMAELTPLLTRMS